MARDLVCQMEVAGEGNRLFSDYNGDMFYFCSEACKRKFDDHPDEFIRSNAKQEFGI